MTSFSDKWFHTLQVVCESFLKRIQLAHFDPFDPSLTARAPSCHSHCSGSHGKERFNNTYSVLHCPVSWSHYHDCVTVAVWMAVCYNLSCFSTLSDVCVLFEFPCLSRLLPPSCLSAPAWASPHTSPQCHLAPLHPCFQAMFLTSWCKLWSHHSTWTGGTWDVLQLDEQVEQNSVHIEGKELYHQNEDTSDEINNEDRSS